MKRTRNNKKDKESKIMLRASGVFATQAKSREAISLIQRAIELRQERMIAGTESLAKLSPDEIIQIGKLAKNGNVDALFKLDCLLSDITGGPGNLFQTMNFKPGTYIDKLLTIKKGKKKTKTIYVMEIP